MNAFVAKPKIDPEWIRQANRSLRSSRALSDFASTNTGGYIIPGMGNRDTTKTRVTKHAQSPKLRHTDR
jgi:hypothetical protein